MIGLTYKDNFSRVFDYTGDVEAFVIPKNATMLHIWAIGAGTNGGAGASRAAGTAGGGGGGGATGAIVTMLVPARFLPPTLYIVVGRGGGLSTDGYSKVMFRRGDTLGSIVADSLLLANTGATNGGAGTTISAGIAGATAGYFLGNNLYAGLGTLTITAGQGGSNGGAITGGAGVINSVFSNGLPFSGGAGGAGCTSTDFTGGSINPSSNAQQHAGFTLAGGGSVFGQYDGLNGLQFDEPFVCYGGSGGGSNNSGVGGKGGDGAIGCGGGGGGAGVTGGAGGRGGNGRVVITWF